MFHFLMKMTKLALVQFQKEKVFRVLLKDMVSVAEGEVMDKNIPKENQVQSQQQLTKSFKRNKDGR